MMIIPSWVGTLCHTLKASNSCYAFIFWSILYTLLFINLIFYPFMSGRKNIFLFVSKASLSWPSHFSQVLAPFIFLIFPSSWLLQIQLNIINIWKYLKYLSHLVVQCISIFALLSSLILAYPCCSCFIFFYTLIKTKGTFGLLPLAFYWICTLESYQQYLTA